MTEQNLINVEVAYALDNKQAILPLQAPEDTTAPIHVARIGLYIVHQVKQLLCPVGQQRTSINVRHESTCLQNQAHQHHQDNGGGRNIAQEGVPKRE